MKVLFITHVTEMAGANRSMFQLIKELKEKYHVGAVVMVPKRDSIKGTIQEALNQIDIPVIETDIWFFKRKRPTPRNIVGYARYLWRQRNLYKQIAPCHFDIIHSNSSVIDIGGFLSRKLKTKHVWHLREFGEEDYSLKPIGGRWYERYTYRHADAFIAISKIIAEHFKSLANPQKIHTIYNGVYFDEDTPISRHQNNVIQFFCAGILCEGKNQKELVFAIDELVNKRGLKQLHLTLVGIPTQPYTDELKILIQSKKLKDYVDILSEVNGIQALVAQMDVGLMPSKAEAFGRVTIEYQMQNLLVIANDAGANPELIEDSVTGLLYSAGNFHSLADKMQWAMMHPVRLQEIAQKGMEKAQLSFTSERNTQEIYGLYRELLRKS